MTAGQHKGDMLYDLLKLTGTPLPRVVVMADDSPKNMDAIQETMEAIGVTARTWLYTGEEDIVAAFDSETSHQMLSELLPAMQTIQRIFGPDNFELPLADHPSLCAESPSPASN
jgi:hypothetical protein